MGDSALETEGQIIPETEPLELEEGNDDIAGDGIKNIPIERFNQINERYKSYKEFGKPDEIRARLDRLQAYEDAISKHRQTLKPPANANTGDDDERTAILKQAKEAGIATKEDMDTNFNRIIKNNMNAASRHFASTLEKENIKATPKMQDEIEDLFWSRMSEDDRTSVMYGDFAPIDKMLQSSIKEGMLSKLKTQGLPPPVPPVRHGSGGTPPQVPKEGPKTWKDADDLAFSMFKKGE